MTLLEDSKTKFLHRIHLKKTKNTFLVDLTISPLAYLILTYILMLILGKVRFIQGLEVPNRV